MQMEGAWRQLPFLLILLVVNVLGLLNLPGRSPFVFVIVIMLALAVFRRRSLLGKLKEVTRGLVLLAVMVGAGFAAISYVGIEVSSLLVFRIMELVENTDSEARVGIYDVALRLILRQPLGYGLGAYPYLAVGPYPHNFIVELAFAGGVVAAGFAALATTLGLGRAVRSYRTTSEPLTLQLTGVLLYLVCTFMVSYALKDTYVLFCVLGLVFGLTHPREERVALTTGPGGSYSS
jgi:O-antigen ligase